MTPDDIARRCEAWTRDNSVPKRVVCVEPDGPRRTWLLFEAGRQVGHVRGRNPQAEEWERYTGRLEAAGVSESHIQYEQKLLTKMLDPNDDGGWFRPWTWEAANAGREVLGG